MQDEIFAFYRANKVKRNVMQIFPMEQFAEALSLVKNGKAQGKVVLATNNHKS
ncbi:zinc-binding dehydrogenase [Glaciimonas immobilis]|uniref:D-arabinose 1-dehydrogenase-like Zn-dependent alcohol dehydrogenase n=1 Tax=Glaciimonas immobilis TaxID=728004 RepID=A0A840RTB9_9BURK|nr:zinc-binding dehydrogenase [Glaciimonas immobilis]KAF3997079.1 zinc-binding dehydrogenase [Glaciimonas immobilis]MBB5199934.1 D-arabinose 1-dehydrogenase-like Zn-dependent alcohol dehydrogenase [Glaciimonas immobilis]